MEQLEQQASKLTDVETKYEALKDRMNKIDEIHRQDIRIVKADFQKREEEYREEISFLREQLKRKLDHLEQR
jgi:hypothetical protein